MFLSCMFGCRQSDVVMHNICSLTSMKLVLNQKNKLQLLLAFPFNRNSWVEKSYNYKENCYNKLQTKSASIS